jgi:hypothetical protein
MAKGPCGRWRRQKQEVGSLVALLPYQERRRNSAGHGGDGVMDPKQLAERRAFHAQMRARIRLVAHERGIPKEEVKAALGLRHEPLIAFAKKHQLDFKWLLAGDLNGLLHQVRRQATVSGRNV